MAEIIRVDQFGAHELNGITGITNFNSKIAVISGKHSSKNLALYNIDKNGMLYNGPKYISKLLGKNIISISSYKHFLLILTDEQKIYVTTYNHNHINHNNIGCNSDGISELNIKNSNTGLMDNFKNYLFDQILKIIKKCSCGCLLLKHLIIVKSQVYFFVQVSCDHLKHKLLFVLEGSICDDNKLTLSDQIKLQTFFNLYGNGRINGLSKEKSKHVTLKSVCFDFKSNNFILLLTYGGKGYLGKIKKYTEFDGMSSRIETFECDNSLLKINDNPRALTYLEDDMLLIITDKVSENLNKYVIVKII